jgi:hypothetical protein
MLFKTLEKHIVSKKKKLEQGFENRIDVDDFISFRAGFAFENHLESILNFKKCYCSKGAKLKGINLIFFFPSIKNYHNPDFPVELLTMLVLRLQRR